MTINILSCFFHLKSYQSYHSQLLRLRVLHIAVFLELDISKSSSGQQCHFLKFLPIDAILIFIVNLVQTFEHIDCINNRLLVRQILLDGGEHFLTAEDLISVGVVLLKDVQEFLLKLLVIVSVRREE